MAVIEHIKLFDNVSCHFADTLNKNLLLLLLLDKCKKTIPNENKYNITITGSFSDYVIMR